MKKKIAVLAVIAALVAVMTACGSSVQGDWYYVDDFDMCKMTVTSSSIVINDEGDKEESDCTIKDGKLECNELFGDSYVKVAQDDTYGTVLAYSDGDIVAIKDKDKAKDYMGE